MSDILLSNSRAKFRTNLNIEWQNAIVGDGLGNIIDPYWPESGMIQVRFLTDNGYTTPTLVRGPSRQLARALTDGLNIKVKYDAHEPYVDDIDTKNAIVSGYYPVQSPPTSIGAGDGGASQDQLLTLRCSQNADQPSLVVYIGAWIPIINNVAYSFPGDFVDLTSFVPSSGQHCCVVIFVTSDYSTTEVFASTPTDLVNALTIDDLNEALAAASAGSTPAWSYDLHGGATTVLDTDTFLDARQLVNVGQNITPGDVSGPGSSTDRAIATWNGTTGIDLRDNPNTNVDTNGNLTANEYKYPTAQAATLASDAFTVSKGYAVITSETGTSDNLATINGGSGRQDLTIQAASGHTITVKNGTGNIFLNSGSDFVLSGDKTLRLFYDGTNWSDIGAGGGGTGGGIAASIGGNTTGTPALISTGTMYLIGGSNLTLDQSGNSITFDVAAQSQQTQNIIRQISILGNTSGTPAEITSGSFYLSGGNNVTLSQQGVTVEVSAGGALASLLGNTTGTVAPINGPMYMAGGNNVTLSQSGNTVTISAAPQTVQTQSLIQQLLITGHTSGTPAAITSGSVYMSGGNNVTLSQNSNTIEVSAGGVPAFVIGGNTAGTSSSMTSGTITLYGQANITLVQIGNLISFIGASQPNPFIMSHEPYPIHNTGTASVQWGTATSGPITLIPFEVQQQLFVRHMNVLASVTTGVSSGASTGTLMWAIYSRDIGSRSTRINSMISNSMSIAASFNAAFNNLAISQATTTNDTGYGTAVLSSTASAGLLTAYSGLKMFQLLMQTTLQPGNYWMGLMAIGSTSGQSGFFPIRFIGNSNTLSGLAPFGSASSDYSQFDPNGLGGAWPMFMGKYTDVGLNSFPSAIALSNVSAGQTIIPYFSFANTF